MLLNLHCHSSYTDGANSLRELALMARECDHVALCLTDHNYMFSSPFVWERECAEAESLSLELDYPIIVGLEYWVPKVEEVLVFGKEACRSLLMADISGVNQFKDWYMSQKNPFALILAHPFLWTNAPDFYLLMDGYEVVNSGFAWDENYVKKMKAWMPEPRRAYKGQDTHGADDFSHPCNEIADEMKIKNESDLIKYLSVVKEWSY
jgi:hypothetical protein